MPLVALVRAARGGFKFAAPLRAFAPTCAPSESVDSSDGFPAFQTTSVDVSGAPEQHADGEAHTVGLAALASQSSSNLYLARNFS
jgi:hypothetical protein